MEQTVDYDLWQAVVSVVLHVRFFKELCSCMVDFWLVKFLVGWSHKATCIQDLQICLRCGVNFVLLLWSTRKSEQCARK
jgi:hypothetical protein